MRKRISQRAARNVRRDLEILQNRLAVDYPSNSTTFARLICDPATYAKCDMAKLLERPVRVIPDGGNTVRLVVLK